MDLRQELYQIADSLAQDFEEVNEFIYQHPELGNEEFISSRYLVEKIASYGFETTYPYCGLETAFRAEMNCGEGPTVAFLAEYDALPGYGENGDQVGHACGHNWIAASTLGASVVLSKMKEHFSGTIVYIGTPAEETTGRKYDLVKNGAFDKVDAAFQMHLGAENNLNVTTLAMDSLQFDFTGLAAHAAAFPEKGVNALDAVNLTFAGVNALREHIQSSARVHGIVTLGGQAVNTVPAQASCQFYIRAKTRAYLEELTQKIINCAKGAELMTGATLAYHYFENSYDNLSNHQGLVALAKANLEDLGVTHFANRSEDASGSSDIGNVSQVCPTCYVELDIEAQPPAFVHDEAFLNYVSGSIAYDKLHKAIKAMAYTALEVLLDPTVVNTKK